MTSSSTEPTLEPLTRTVVRGGDATTIRESVAGGDLRTGTWTRLGTSNMLGDSVTERALSSLAESTRSAARAQGYAVGWAEGRRQAEEQARAVADDTARRNAEAESRREQEHQAAVSALELAAARLHEALASTCALVEEQATSFAFDLARTLVGRELTLAADPGADAVRRVEALLPTTPAVTVRMNPADTATPALATLAERGVAVVGDPSVTRGDAVVDAQTHVIDARIETAIARVREVLLP